MPKTTKKIKIPKSFFKKLKCKPFTVPTIKCPVCGEEILDTPSNRLIFIPK
jgi:4-hydroxy-3-methylbut-2-en-1-yl diphosphate synthase IspG/GcpE